MSTQFPFTRGITHGGIFHADDVFSVALVKMLNPDIEITRRNVRPDEVIPDDTIVFDVGGGKFDHHDPKHKQMRDSGIQFAAFGLLWREFGHLLVDEMGWNSIEQSLVVAIDLADNGRERNPLSLAIAMLNPLWDKSENGDDQFWHAVNHIATPILARAIEAAHSTQNAGAIVAKAIADCPHSPRGVVVLDTFVPWASHIPTDSGIRICVFPSNREPGQFNLQTINSDEFPLPLAWTEALPDGMTFCHRGRFLASCVDRDTAIRYALEAAANFR